MPPQCRPACFWNIGRKEAARNSTPGRPPARIPETSFALLDLWIISLFEYQRDGGERSYRLLKFIRFGSGYGELVEETP